MIRDFFVVDEIPDIGEVSLSLPRRVRESPINFGATAIAAICPRHFPLFVPIFHRCGYCFPTKAKSNDNETCRPTRPFSLFVLRSLYKSFVKVACSILSPLTGEHMNDSDSLNFPGSPRWARAGSCEAAINHWQLYIQNQSH